MDSLAEISDDFSSFLEISQKVLKEFYELKEKDPLMDVYLVEKSGSFPCASIQCLKELQGYFNDPNRKKLPGISSEEVKDICMHLERGDIGIVSYIN